jgi:hypothetical protein
MKKLPLMPGSRNPKNMILPISKVAGTKLPFVRWNNGLRGLVCALAMGLFAWNAMFFYLPGKGFTYLIQFGDQEHARYLPELRAVNHYEAVHSNGYDAQYYAQIAMRPRLGDPVLAKAVDNLPYRARRILFSWTAWVLAAGMPILALNIYALQNVASWYLLAFLLFRWLPPVSWGNVARWVAVMFSFGLLLCVKGALVDGPSLLLIAVGIALVESNRPWLAAAVLGVSGLGKETNIMCAAGMRLPDRTNPRAWAPWLARCALVLLPLAVWMVCIRLWLGTDGSAGARNFAAPFAGLANKLQDSISQLAAEGLPSLAKFDLLVLVGLMVQFFFFVFRRRWDEPWWRVGVCYAVLMIFLGNAVWEFYPSAAARVLLPMTLAFNILVPRKGWWVALLVIGNLGLLGSANVFSLPKIESYIVTGPREFRINPKDGGVVEATFDVRHWYGGEEKSRWEYFRWAGKNSGDATVTIHNPRSFTLVAKLGFKLRPIDKRVITVAVAGNVLWTRELQEGRVESVSLGPIELPPGDTNIKFRSDRESMADPKSDDPRKLTFSLRQLQIDLIARR